MPEPTDEEIQSLIQSSNGSHSFYTAREELREAAYSKEYNKPVGQDWGTFWKTY